MTVTDAIRESMSAVMDGEGSELDVARVLKAIEADPEARDHWRRLQRAGSLLRTGQDGPALDVSDAVREAIARPAGSARRLGPLGSLAVAASVTFAVVLGGQSLLSQTPFGSVATPVATTVPGGIVPIPGAAPVQARFGVNNIPTNTSSRLAESPQEMQGAPKIYDQLARERYLRYATEHARSTAHLQPNAHVPFARAPDESATQ